MFNQESIMGNLLKVKNRNGNYRFVLKVAVIVNESLDFYGEKRL
jgi:hypothetical protein